MFGNMFIPLTPPHEVHANHIGQWSKNEGRKLRKSWKCMKKLKLIILELLYSLFEVESINTWLERRFMRFFKGVGVTNGKSEQDFCLPSAEEQASLWSIHLSRLLDGLWESPNVLARETRLCTIPFEASGEEVAHWAILRSFRGSSLFNRAVILIDWDRKLVVDMLGPQVTIRHTHWKSCPQSSILHVVDTTQVSTIMFFTKTLPCWTASTNSKTLQQKIGIFWNIFMGRRFYSFIPSVGGLK